MPAGDQKKPIDNKNKQGTGSPNKDNRTFVDPNKFGASPPNQNKGNQPGNKAGGLPANQGTIKPQQQNTGNKGATNPIGGQKAPTTAVIGNQKAPTQGGQKAPTQAQQAVSNTKTGQTQPNKSPTKPVQQTNVNPKQQQQLSTPQKNPSTQITAPNSKQRQQQSTGGKQTKISTGKENQNVQNQIPNLYIDPSSPQTRQYTNTQPAEKYNLSEIPEHMRDDIRDLIERKVEERVHHEMEYLRAEAHGVLEFQRRGNLAANPKWPGRYWDGHHWPQQYGGYGHGGYPHSGYHPYHHGYPYGYYGGYGYYGQPYGQTGYVPKNEEDEYLYNIATSAKMRTRSPIVGKRSQMLNYATDKTVEFQIDSPQGPKSKEYVVQRVSKGEEALSRRKAYDAHLKTDIMLSGRDRSMNKTYDPYYHPYWAAPPVNHPNQGYAYGPYKPSQQSGIQSDAQAYESPAEASPKNQRR